MIRLSALILLSLTAPPVLACNEALVTRLDALPGGAPDVSLDVAEIASTEGGEWQVWQDGGGTSEMARTDYGEMGRWVTRLVWAAPDAYAVTSTHFAYSAPIYVPGMTTIREEKDIFLFCAGTLSLPGEDSWVSEDYVAKAREALTVFDAAEIADYVPEMAR